MTTRAYRLSFLSNQGKEGLVRALLPHWQYALDQLVKQAYREYILQGQPTPKRRLLKPGDLGFTTLLSSRQVDSVWTQAYGALSSWEAQAQDAYRTIITRSRLDEFTKVTLYRLNQYKSWFAKKAQLPMWVSETGELTHQRRKNQVVWDVPGDILRLSRNIMRRVLKTRAPLPNMKRVRTMLMDGKVARVEQSNNTQDLWVRVSTLTKGKPVLVPLNYHKYAREAAGELNRGVMVRVDKRGKVTYAVTKTSDPAPLRETGESIGLDWGLVTLFADSRGNQYGQSLYSWLKERDEELLALTRALAQNGVKPSNSKRYKAFNHRIREYVKNEVNRVLNKLAVQDIKELVVESLDFRHSGLSKRLNRLLTRAGRGAVKAKLKDLTERYGIQVTKVNPAYSSQECPKCSWVGRENRPSQSRFKCVKCSYASLADVVAARNLLGRSQDDRFGVFISKEKIREHLLVRYHALRVELTGEKIQPLSCSTA